MVSIFYSIITQPPLTKTVVNYCSCDGGGGQAYVGVYDDIKGLGLRVGLGEGNAQALCSHLQATVIIEY